MMGEPLAHRRSTAETNPYQRADKHIISQSIQTGILGLPLVLSDKGFISQILIAEENIYMYIEFVLGFGFNCIAEVILFIVNVKEEQ